MFYLNLLICVIIQLKKGLKKNISYLEFFFKNINIFKFFLFRIDKNVNPFYSSKFVKYININKNKLQKINTKINNNQNILVESFINQPAYTVSNAIISFYLKQIFKGEITTILREGDIKSEIIFRSFGVKKFIYYKNQNFIQKIVYNYKALKFLNKKNNINSIVKLKYNNINLGLTAYDSYIRYVGNPTLEKVNLEFVTFVSEGLYACDYFSKLLKKSNFKKLVQSETSFIPLSCLFQVSLSKKIEVFSRFGKEKFTVRRYTDLKQCFSERGRISQKLFDIIYKKYKEKALLISNKIQNIKLKTGSFGMDITMYKFKRNSAGKKILELIDEKKIKSKQKIFVNKNYINNLFDWKNKKIAVFFLSYLIDGNFPFGYRENFKDTYSWTKFIFDKIPKIKNVNWIIKDHPITKVYGQEPKIDFNDKINELEKNYNHIKRWPKHISNDSLLKITDIALTSSGTVGIEYPAYRVRSVYTEKSSYSNLNFMKMIKSKKKITKVIKNFHKLDKPKSELINKCKLYLFIRESLIGEKPPLLPDYVASRNIIDDEFWDLCIKKIAKLKLSKDVFFQMLKKQVKFKSRHTLNYKIINFNNTIFDDFKD